MNESHENAVACRQIESDMNDETVIVCPYCGTEKGNRFSCCGEVHFVEMSRKAWEDGEVIV